MPHPAFTWNPAGLQRLSFKGFVWFPISPRKQLGAGFISLLLIIIGSFGCSLLPIPNLNLLLFAVIGYFLADHIHPHPLVGPAIVTFSTVGLGWLLVMWVPDYFILPPSFMLTVFGNLFGMLALGAVIATVIKAKQQ